MLQPINLTERFRSTIAFFVVSGLCAGIWHGWPRSPLAGQPAVASTDNSAQVANLQCLGVSSCASTACHYGSGAQGAKGSEYTTWATLDKHSKAYNVLFDELSRTIVRNYKRLKVADAPHPEREALCLGCHAPDQPGQVLGGPPLIAGTAGGLEGVGCESCHGPAERWRTAHYLPDWAQKSDSEKEALGMRPTKDLVARAKLCAECHIGTARYEVNHDLIAAGHPRLNFEFSAYLANMPSHWREQGANARADFPARSWAVGQVISARAALELLEARARSARDAKTQKPWPEFAEYDCFACHHDLRDDTERQKSVFGKRTPGSYPWGTWYYTLLPEIARQQPNAARAKVTDSLRELQALMARPYPDPVAVANLARTTHAQLDHCVKAADAPLSRASLESLLSGFSHDKFRSEATDWDGCTQLYLAIVPLYQASQGMRGLPENGEVLAELAGLRSKLQFHSGFNSPGNFHSQDFLKELDKLQHLAPQ